MPKFDLTCVITVSAYTTVEADTLEEAIEIAEGRTPVMGQYRENRGSEHWIVDELDGCPCDIQDAR